MQFHFPKPNIVLSRCLELEACRYNGQVISDRIVRAILPHINPVPVCPEVEIGMGTPREPVRIVRQDGQERLLQPSTGNDFTDRMNDFSAAYTESLQEVDGFILKSRSPSCGIRDTKIYPKIEKAPVIDKGSGLFARQINESFPDSAIEDEGRLTNARIREHFLSATFSYARFRAIEKDLHIRDLVKFQAEHKLLFMTSNQTAMRELGRIVANPGKLPAEEVFSSYKAILPKVFRRQPRFQSHVNAQMHAFGYFSDSLSAREKAHFLDLLEKYRSGQIPISVINSLMLSWILRFEADYLESQYYFQPFPEKLSRLPDSAKSLR